METITKDQLIDHLENLHRGAQPVTFNALTDTRARSNPYGKIFKVSRVNGMTGANYENSVNRQRGREESDQDFVAQAPKWGEVVNPYLLRHRTKGTYYLRVKVENVLSKPVFLRALGKTFQIIKKDLVVGYLPKKRKPTNQGTKKEIVWRTWGIDGILTISIGGKRFKIVR